MQLYEHMFVFVTIPDLELRAAMEASGRPWSEDLPLAFDAGDHGRASGYRRTGSVNRAARLQGVRPGMTVGQAIDLCPGLGLLRPDPVAADRAWEEILSRLEGIGASVESPEIGRAWFEPDGLTPLYGGMRGVLEAVFEALDGDCLAGVGPTRLAASIDLAASAREIMVIRHEDLEKRLDALPLESLRGRLGIDPVEEEGLISSLGRLGFERLGEIRVLGSNPMADRFGGPGIRAWEIAAGREGSLRPRRPEEEMKVELEIPDDGSSMGIAPALAIACARLSVRLESAGRAARSVRLEAALRDGGSWSCERSPRTPTSNPDLIRIPFEPALERIPAMPTRLGLVATGLTEGVAFQPALFERTGDLRRRRLDEAVRQVKAVVGDPGLLKVVEASPRSRLPERRVMLIPRNGEGGRDLGLAER